MKLSTGNYLKIRKWLRARCGVELGDARQTMVSARLIKRCVSLSMSSIDEYVEHLATLEPLHQEWNHFVDELTTHETYFYREAVHFEFLQHTVFNDIAASSLKVLSAACSTGEEAYSLAIETNDYFKDNQPWQVYGVDISAPAIKVAQKGLYTEKRAQLVPEHHRKSHFLKGLDNYNGLTLVKEQLKSRVSFSVANILQSIPNAPFDVIFCRNVLIYFDWETKQKAITNLLSMLNPGGYLFVSQTEQLRGLIDERWRISPSIMRKPS